MSSLSQRHASFSRRRKTGRGSVLVELSLVGVMFFVLIIGIVDFGQFLFIQQAMVERVRSAARWGATTDPTNSVAIQNMVLYLQPTVPPSETASFGLTSAMVSVSTADPGTDNYRLVVRISGYSYSSLSFYLARTYQGPAINVSVPLGLYN